MERIKKKLMNETKCRELLKENFMAQNSFRNKNIIITEFNSPDNRYLNDIYKLRKATTIFNNNKSDFKSEFFHKKLNKAESGKFTIKYKLNKIKGIKSNPSTQNILPFVTNNSFHNSKNQNLSLKNKDIINNYNDLTLNDNYSKKNLKNKYSKTSSNIFIESYDNKQKNYENINYYIKNEKENDSKNIKIKFSTLLKKLDNWDKEHCQGNIKKSDINLYDFLFNYYQKNDLKEEQKKLLFASNLLKSRRYYNNLIEENQNNKVFLELLKRSQKETGTILKYNLYKTQIKFGQLFQQKYSKDFVEDLDIEPEILNLIIQDDLKNIFYNKIIREKMKYEHQLHEELSKINIILFDKKILKEEKTKKIKQLDKDKNILKKEYNNKYNLNKKAYWIKYDNYEHLFKKLITNNKEQTNNLLKKENDDEEENISNINNGNITYKLLQRNKTQTFNFNNIKRSNTHTSIKKKNDFYEDNKKIIEDSKKQKREIESLKKFRLLNMNNEMSNKLREMHKLYQNRIDDINKERKQLEDEIKIIKDEIEYYSQVNDELLKENKSYYLEKLKKGFDCRKEGLMWVVANLMEMQVPLEYHHFPKYLTNEQIDYLKSYANLQLMQNQVKIILKVLKKKQFTQKAKEILKSMNDIDNGMDFENKNEKIEINENNQQYDLIDDYNNYSLLAKNKIDKKFSKLYQEYVDVMNNYLKKNMENSDYSNVIDEIKKSIYQGNNLFAKKENNDYNDILNEIIGDQNKYYKFLLDTKSHFQFLEEEKKKLFEKEKENFMKLIQKSQGHKASINNVIKNEMIKKCLFGTRLG